MLSLSGTCSFGLPGSSQAATMNKYSIVIGGLLLLVIATTSTTAYQAGRRDGIMAERARQNRQARDNLGAPRPEPAVDSSRISRNPQPVDPGPELERDEPAFEPIKLSNRGNQISERFSLPQGLLAVKAQHSGDDDFSVSLRAINGSADRELLIEENGNGQFSQSVQVTSAGDFLIEVRADGDWSVELYAP